MVWTNSKRMILLSIVVGLSSAHGGHWHGKLKTKRLVNLVSRGKSKFEDKILEASNKFRAMHGAPALKWDTGLQATATEWAEHLAAVEQFSHSKAGDKGLGENLYYAMGWPEGKIPGLAVQKWYDEIKDYNFNKPGFGYNTGHFTQLVWKDTTKVGCGMATSASGKMYVCCNYSPPGNYMGEFEENVLPASQ